MSGYSVRMLNPVEAARRLAGLAELDPRGMATEAAIPAMCQTGLSFEVSDSSGAAVVVVRMENGVAWIDAAGGGGGADLCPAIDAAVAGLPCNSVAFQTKRRGLVRRAEKLGYHVAGYIMRRDL